MTNKWSEIHEWSCEEKFKSDVILCIIQEVDSVFYWKITVPSFYSDKGKSKNIISAKSAAEEAIEKYKKESEE